MKAMDFARQIIEGSCAGGWKPFLGDLLIHPPASGLTPGPGSSGGVEPMDAMDEARAKMKAYGIEPGQIYRHYKGGLYVIVCTAVREDTLVPVVVYHSNRRGTNTERTLENFTEMVPPIIEADGPDAVPRFRREKD